MTVMFKRAAEVLRLMQYWHGTVELANKLGCTRRTAARYIDWLQDAGWLVEEREHPNKYQSVQFRLMRDTTLEGID